MNFLNTLFYITIFLCNIINSSDFITIAILAKDKAHTLPLFLNCIANQTWPKDKTYLYIRTNNNNDNTATVLKTWAESVAEQYAAIYFDDTDIPEPVQQYEQHEWNSVRFKVLGKIRQDSINWAMRHNSHYFVVDCDNFIKPHTIEAMFMTNLPIVAPFLKSATKYSNYHAAIDSNGYFENCSLYYDIFDQKIKGCIEVPVVHCTYFIRNKFLPEMLYDDGSSRYEYVIFSDNARKKNIAQYLDNRKNYGYLTFATDAHMLIQELWLQM